MAISSKEITLLFISLVAAVILSFFLPKFLNWKNLDIMDLFIFLILVVIMIIWVIYTKIREVNDDLDQQKMEIKKLDERLKIHNQLVNLEARLIALEKGGKNGKKR